MTPQQKKELWRWAVANRATEMKSTLTEIRSTFRALVGDGAFESDKVTLIDRQMRVVELELESLRHSISRYTYTPIRDRLPIAPNPTLPATDANVQQWFNDQLKGGDDLETTWHEYQRLLSIYTNANDEQKWEMAADAFLRT